MRAFLPSTLLLLSSCTTALRPVAAPEDDRLIREIARTSDGMRVGRLLEVDAHSILLDRPNGGWLRLVYTEATPVFRAGQQVSPKSLKPGADVLVPLRDDPGRPRALAIIVRDQRR
jgi:hypothetical protein